MKRLAVFDFDATLVDSPEKEEGKMIWQEKTGQEYPHIGWWGRKESLDTSIFDIKAFPSVLNQLNQETNIPDTHVIILTSRMEKLRPEVEKVLDMNNIFVDDVILKKGNEGKGDVILRIVQYNPDLEEINVYDDYMDKNPSKIAEYLKIKDLLPENIKYNLYLADNGKISLMKSINEINDIINEEIENFLM
jgi:hypothetical protein